MTPDIPSGRAARDAWRALSPQARRSARLAADRHIAPPDPGLAWAAAGYGRTMAGRLRVAILLAPFIMVLLVIPTVALASQFRTPAPGMFVLVGLLLAVLIAIAALGRARRRYRQLYDSGLLGVEATQLGVTRAVPTQAVWAPEADPSGFTVPYQATVPVPATLPRPPADPVAAGVETIPVRRQAVVTAALMYGLIAAGLWLAAFAVPDDFSAFALAGFAALVTAFLAYLLFLAAPGFRSGVAARFTPAGWELPGQRLSGPWSDVREIRIGPVQARNDRSASALAGYRVVVLMVDHPDGYLVRVSPMRRRLVRRTMNRYGSPVGILTGPRRGITMVDLVQLLHRYTDAPVTWG